MKKVDGNITKDEDGVVVEEQLFTYSEDEREQNRINKENASLIFTPEFIPYRMNIKKAFDLTHIETLIYGFVRFYKANSSKRFYFTNEQIAEIVDCSESTAEKAMANLINKKLFKASYRVRAGGGKSRFITAVLAENGESDLQKTDSQTSRKLQGNNNKINKNKINIKSAKAENIKKPNNSSYKELRDAIGHTPNGATYEWQDYAVRMWGDLGLSDNPTPSWFKLFRDSYKNNRKALLVAAYSTVSDVGADNPEKYFYKVYYEKLNGN